MPPPAKVDFAEARVAPAPAAPAASTNPGSLYQSSSYRPAFEDRRARLVGDTVTVKIVEALSASQVSKSTVNRNTSASNTIATAPVPSVLGPDLGNLNMSVKTDNDFSGKGGTEAANTFTGAITATVIDVQPNGNLVIAGEKQIGLNQNVDVLRFSGTVDPRLLQPGSVINSTQIANVRVESRGRGAQAEAQTVGWLSRFFLNLNPF
ncbi:MAG: flagellar basal body L-ring protein FlgH [Rhodoferax sp.]